MQAGPLAGVRVLELGTLIAGPFCTRLLAEFGAEVVKIESPDGGDPIRQWRKLHEGTSLWWSVQARNKKSVAVNLKDARGQQIVRALALEADIVVENYRPGVLEKWGVGYEQLKALDASQIMVRISGYGQTGPMKDKPGFGAIGESMGGMRFVTGHADRPPVRMGISIGDSLAALHGAFGALAALHHRNATGGKRAGTGQLVDVALYEAVFNMMESLVPEYDMTGFIRERTGGALPGIVPSNTYTCKDGQSILVSGNGDAIFKRLMHAIGRSDLANDPALARNDGRVPRTAEIDTAIGAWCATQTIDAALDHLNAADVPAGKAYSVADMFKDPQFLARQMIEQHRLADGTPIKLPAVTPKLWPGPKLGEHTDEVLLALGYVPAEIAQLRADGVIV
jgi:formyl-CoA transferase